MGILSTFLVLGMCKRIRITEGEETILKHIHWGRFFAYPFWLIWQVLLANVRVAYLVLHPKVPVDPALVRFSPGIHSRLAQVVLGNSITLTPGTVTLGLSQGDFVVHALTEPLASGLLVGDMQRRVAAVFGEDLVDSSEVELLRTSNMHPSSTGKASHGLSEKE